MGTSRPTAARQRLVETASQIFYAEGIHAVGVDRLVSATGVTRTTFYRHFPTKEHLVVAHVEYQDQLIRTAVAKGTADLPAEERIMAFFDGLAAQICGDGFRGCPFINAAAEYPDPAHPVRVAVTAHRTWLENTFVELLGAAGHPDPGFAARNLVLLRDGAMIGGYLDDPTTVQDTVRTAVRKITNSTGDD